MSYHAGRQSEPIVTGRLSDEEEIMPLYVVVLMSVIGLFAPTAEADVQTKQIEYKQGDTARQGFLA